MLFVLEKCNVCNICLIDFIIRILKDSIFRQAAIFENELQCNCAFLHVVYDFSVMLYSYNLL